MRRKISILLYKANKLPWSELQFIKRKIDQNSEASMVYEALIGCLEIMTPPVFVKYDLQPSPFYEISLTFCKITIFLFIFFIELVYDTNNSFFSCWKIVFLQSSNFHNGCIDEKVVFLQNHGNKNKGVINL